MNRPELRGKKVLVAGLARSGLAAANFLLRRGARVTVTDVKPEAQLSEVLERLEAGASLALGGHRREDFLDSDLIVLSPGVPSALEELREAAGRGIPVWSEVELAYRFLEGRFLGITGSNGKTTTTALTGRIFEDAGVAAAVAGNIGVPLIQWADEPAPPGVFVVELSSFQLENVHRFRCHAAAFLNATPDHLDRYPGFEDYVAAKKRIFRNQTSDDFAVVNQDDPVASGVRGLGGRRVPFSRKAVLDEGVFVRDGEIHFRLAGRSGVVMAVEQIRLRGAHNLENVLAAVAIGLVCGLEPASMARSLAAFPGVEHRLEFVRNLEGIDFYNDSKATNVDSAAKAIESFQQPLLLILGGLDKGGEFAALRPLVQARAKRVFVIGKAASKIAAALTGAAPLEMADGLEEAVRGAYREAGAGDVVLLAPACASFDAFENYEHRGRVFKQLVGQLRPKGERMAG